MADNKYRILVTDPENILSDQVKNTFTDSELNGIRIEIRKCDSYQKTAELVREFDYDLLIFRVGSPEETMETVKNCFFRNCPVIAVSDENIAEAASSCFRYGASDYVISDGLFLKNLLDSVKRIFDKKLENAVDQQQLNDQKLIRSLKKSGVVYALTDLSGKTIQSSDVFFKTAGLSETDSDLFCSFCLEKPAGYPFSFLYGETPQKKVTVYQCRDSFDEPEFFFWTVADYQTSEKNYRRTVNMFLSHTSSVINNLLTPVDATLQLLSSEENEGYQDFITLAQKASEELSRLNHGIMDMTHSEECSDVFELDRILKKIWEETQNDSRKQGRQIILNAQSARIRGTEKKVYSLLRSVVLSCCELSDLCISTAGRYSSEFSKLLIPCGKTVVLTISSSGLSENFIRENHILKLQLEALAGMCSGNLIYETGSAEIIFSVAKAISQTVTKNSGIMVVDDNSAVRKLTAKLLQKKGYLVFEAESGMEAETIMQQNIDKIQLIILDAVMPEKSGVETFEALRTAGITVPVLVFSGCGLDGDVQQMLDLGAKDFIKKPYDVPDLFDKVSRIIG